MTIEQIKDLITRAKYKQALQAIAELEVVQQNDDFKLQIEALQARYNQNERANLLGIADNYGVESRKITFAILSLLQELREQEENPISPTPLTPTSSPSPSKPAPVLDNAEVTKILFMASNPSDTAKLQLTHEHSLISARLQEAEQPDQFPLIFKRAVTPSEFQRFIFQYKPNIVHFSGHGDRQQPDVQSMLTRGAGRPDPGASSDPNTTPTQEESGIFLYDEDRRNAHFVNTSYLKRVFQGMVERQGIPIKIVLFNACHSSQQAQAISQFVPYVIGTSWTVGDKAASAFARGFYFGISANMGVEDAVHFAITETLPYQEPEGRYMLYKDGARVEL